MRYLGKVLSLVLVILFLSSLVMLQPTTVKAQAKSIVVPDDYPTIQSAIDHANAGDTVFIKSGNYNESLVVNKSISLLGENKDKTTITVPTIDISVSAQNPYVTIANPPVAIQVNADDVSISNLTINNYRNLMGIGIRTEANATQIIGNIINGQIEAISTNESFTIITNNVLSGESGIDSYGSSNIDILNNQIVSVTSHGIDTHDTSFSSISDNSITGSEGVGISIEGNSNIIQNNAVFGLSDGMYIFSGDNNVLRTNDIANCSDIGIEGGQGLNNILTQNNVTRCQIGVEMGLEANNNTLYYNFFVNNLQEAKTQSNAFNNWDNGTTGNYWSDYQSRYPNATEIDSSGIGNTPYAIDPNNIDNYPLLHQTGISKLTSIAGISWLTIIIIVLALIGIIFFSLLLYRRHRKLYLKQ